ncbi:MAG: DUF5050 domain-containing protein [Acetivibrionales bacterium]
MKKVFGAILLIIVILLSACRYNRVGSNNEDNHTVIDKSDVPTTKESIIEENNTVTSNPDKDNTPIPGGMIAEYDEWLYFSTEDDTGDRCLCKWNPKSNKIEIVVQREINRVFVEDAWVYYTIVIYDDFFDEVKEVKLYRERIDGTEKILIISGNISIRAVIGDYIYYTYRDDIKLYGTLYRMKASEEKSEVVVKNDCYEPFFMQDSIYYVKTGDEYAFYRMDLDGGNDTKLFDIMIRNYNVTSIAYYKDKIYFLEMASTGGKEKRGIYSANLDGSDLRHLVGEEEVWKFVVIDNKIYYVTLVDSGKPSADMPESNYYYFMLNVFDIETNEKKALFEIDSQGLEVTDGYVYFYRNRKLTRISTDTNEEEVLTR